MRRKFWAIRAGQELQTLSGLVSSCVCTPVLSVAELLSSGVSFVRPIGCLGCLEGLFWLPSPGGVAEGVERRGITAGVRDWVWV